MIVVLVRYLDLAAYQEAVRAGTIPRPERCVACKHEKVWFAGFYERWANLQGEGEGRIREKIRVRRCRCPACAKNWSLLPGFCYPHRQYGAETIERAMKRVCVQRVRRAEDLRGPKGWGPSARTVRRWMRWVPGVVREGFLDRLGRVHLPASRATVAASMGYLDRWHAGRSHEDGSALRAFVHGVWQGRERGLWLHGREYAVDAS